MPYMLHKRKGGNMVDTEIEQYPTYLSDMFSTVIEWKPGKTEATKIPVTTVDDIWLIKVNKDRCPVCGTVEKSRDLWCDPRPETWYDNND